jgi:trehalose monomycolate/heme transporter
VLMFLAFGSILLPIKAVLVSALSLSATFGILVWIFQDGHGAGLLHVTPAPLEVGIVVLMAAVVFGLSTDYEVFLLSRMVEARTRGASTPEAVTTGLARTGRVISAAAVLLIVVTGAFALSSITTMRFVGVGMIIALLLDATVVRMLLVPAILGLMGNAAWWSPGPLRRLQERAGLAEYAGEELFPTISVGRHAAPDSAVPGTAVVAYSGAPRPPRHASRPDPGAVPVSPAPAVPMPAGPVVAGVAQVEPVAQDDAAVAGAAQGSPAPAGAEHSGPTPAGAAQDDPAEAGSDQPSPWITPAPIPASAPELGSGPGPAPALPAAPPRSSSARSSASSSDETEPGSPPPRVGTGENPAVRVISGEQHAVRTGTGEQPAVRSGTAERAPVSPAAGSPVPPGGQPRVPVVSGTSSSARVPTGEQPAVSPPPPPAQQTADIATQTSATAPAADSTENVGSTPGESDSAAPVSPAPQPDGDDPELLPTVDLASRMTPAPADGPDPDGKPSPDTTAVLETVDLSAHLQQSPDDPDDPDERD